MSSQLIKKITPGSNVCESLVATTVKDEGMVLQMINKTLPQIELIGVETVSNSFLEAMYLLKKEEYKTRYGKMPEERLLFHVTAASNVGSIIKDNFDWRRIKRGLFGLGTSFSGDAGYADRYANYDIGEERAIIVTKVLVSKTITGKNRMKVPPRKFDTALGNGDKVYVKFSDSEILPKYIVFYKSNMAQNKNKNKSTNKENRRNNYGYQEEYNEEEDYEFEDEFDEEDEYDDEEDDEYEDEFLEEEEEDGEIEDEYDEEEDVDGEYEDEYDEEEEDGEYEDEYDEEEEDGEYEDECDEEDGEYEDEYEEEEEDGEYEDEYDEEEEEDGEYEEEYDEGEEDAYYQYQYYQY